MGHLEAPFCAAAAVTNFPWLTLGVSRSGYWHWTEQRCRACTLVLSRAALSHLGWTVLRNASEVVEMAALAGLVVGFVAAYWCHDLRFGIVLIIPMGLAALEIIVNTARFGVGAMVVWTPILFTLTVGATAAAFAGGRWLSGRRHEVR